MSLKGKSLDEDILLENVCHKERTGRSVGKARHKTSPAVQALIGEVYSTIQEFMGGVERPRKVTSYVLAKEIRAAILQFRAANPDIGDDDVIYVLEEVDYIFKRAGREEYH